MDRNRQSPKVCVVMVNWNGMRHLSYSLSSLEATEYSNVDYLLVDNNSTDGSVEFARTGMPSLTIIRNEENLGWTGGNNVGIRHALRTGAEYVALVNTDMLFHSRWLECGVAAAEEEEAIGIVGFNVIGEYGKEDVEKFKAAARSWSRLEVSRAQHICGCAMLIKLDVIRAIGLLDEEYFCYGDEDDFEYRAQRAGYRMVRVNAPLWHFSEGMAGEGEFGASRLAMRNQLRYAIKNLSPREMAIQAVDLVNIACNPLRRINRNFAHHRRLRPSNVILNGLLLMGAFWWNAVHLPGTLAVRRRELRGMRTPSADLGRNGGCGGTRGAGEKEWGGDIALGRPGLGQGGQMNAVAQREMGGNG
jgi:GT2 family glycosyltransferase